MRFVSERWQPVSQWIMHHHLKSRNRFTQQYVIQPMSNIPALSPSTHDEGQCSVTPARTDHLLYGNSVFTQWSWRQHRKTCPETGKTKGKRDDNIPKKPRHSQEVIFAWLKTKNWGKSFLSKIVTVRGLSSTTGRDLQSLLPISDLSTTQAHLH